MKRIIKTLSASAISTVITVILLILTKRFFLSHLIFFIMIKRGTANDVGESKTAEFMTILLNGVVPCVFILCVLVSIFLTKKKSTQKKIPGW